MFSVDRTCGEPPPRSASDRGSCLSFPVYPQHLTISQPGTLSLYSSSSAFAEHMGVSEDEARRLLGRDGWREMDARGVEEFNAGLKQLLSRPGEGDD